MKKNKTPDLNPRRDSPDNLGELQLIDASNNTIVLGSRFDASLEEISDYLRRSA